MSLNEIPYSKSRVELDWACPRKRYLQYGYGGKGITTSNTSIELYMGTIIHDGLAGIAHGLDIDTLATLAKQQLLDTLLAGCIGLNEEVEYAHEQAALVEGLLRGFERAIWPKLIAAYPRIVCLEEDLEYHHDGLVFMARPDLILANDEVTTYVEYKSTSTKQEGWMTSWSTAVQLHSTVAALKQAKGIEVDQIIVQGLYKGYQSYGRQNSPFCYSYKQEGQPPFPDRYLYEYKPGFRRSPTWLLEGGVKKWVEEMPLEILLAQFPQTPPIFVKWDLVDHFFAQRAARESEIHSAIIQIQAAPQADNSLILDAVFPQNFSECQPPWSKYGCQYKPLCFGNAKADPLSLGYVWKEASPHEAKLLKESK